MKATFNFNGHEFTITDEAGASSYGRPVLEIDGELTDVPVEFAADEPEQRSALDLLADDAGVWGGPATRRELAALADEMEAETGADYDRVIAEFQARKKRLTALEAAE